MIPIEINKFFSEGFSKTLLFKGRPGTGKTTFVFEILIELCPDGNCIYISPRIDKSSSYGRFPWIEGDFNSNEEFFEMLDARVRMVQGAFDEKPLIVIDSIDALSIATTDSSNWLENKFKLERMLIDFGNKTNADILMVTEQTDLTSLDYLVDGVISLEISQISERDIRKVHIHKLRGVGLSQSKYLFTLQDGRFSSFGPFAVAYPKETVVCEPIKDPIRSKISTGTADFDNILGGGYQKGSFNLFEITSGVGDSFYSLLLPTFINHLNLGRGLLSMPSEGTSVETEKSMIEPFCGEDRFKNKFVGFEIREMNGRIPAYVEPLTGNISKDMDSILSVKRELIIQSSGAPILDYVGLDTMEYNYGVEDIGRTIGMLASRTKITQNVVLAVAKHGQKITESVAHMATTHWKFENIDKTLVMYGIVPKTGLYVVEMDFEQGFPHVTLSPVK
ncbi:MAG: hypothetical protein P1P69_00865 [Methanosarcinaceae archaeon]|nr:hypothetical protein [Methanosarcinaceae archaeon]MDF1533041.1 hypothetical protein [Methanosarcinaceae archaeon]